METRTLWRMVGGREVGFTFAIVPAERTRHRGAEGDAYPGSPAYAEYICSSRRLTEAESMWLDDNVEELERDAAGTSAYDAFDPWWIGNRELKRELTEAGS